MHTKLGAAALSFVLVALIAAAVLLGPVGAVAVIGLAALVVVGSRKPKLVGPLIALAGMLFVRPNIWGELYSNVGMAFFLLAAAIAIIQDGGKLLFAGREYRPLRSPLFWVTLAYLWLLVRAAYQGLDNAAQSINGYIGTAICLLSVLLIIGDEDRRGYLVKGFVAVVALVSLSFVATAVLWAGTGIGNGALGSMLIGSWPAPQPVYFPFTTTVSTQPIFGFIVPRFVGFAREPGWMAMYGCIAYFVLPLIGWHSKIVKLAILAAILGTVSTAGFGVLVICAALKFTFGQRSRTPFVGFVRVCFGAGLIAFAVWAAFYAPVLGLDAKGEQNGVSLSERSYATTLGAWAFANDPFSGGLAAEKVGAVNLVAAIAAYGIPFSITMGLAVGAPMFRHPNRRALLPVAAALFLTLLMSQPALDSAWAFALASIGAAAALEPAERPAKKGPRLALPKALPDHYKRLGAQRAKEAATP